MKLNEFKEKLLQNPEFKKEFERFDLWFELEELWIEVRINVRRFINFIFKKS